MSEHDEAKLPRWARERLEELRGVNARLTEKLSNLEQAHAILDRDWFTLRGPERPAGWPDGRDSYTLFLLHANAAQAVCTLGWDDVLLVGRSRKALELLAGELLAGEEARRG